MSTVLLHPNRAQDTDLRKECKDLVIPLMKDTRRDRRTLRETWLRYHRIWSATRDQEAYNGRDVTYFAKGRKIIDNWVRRLKRDLFPSDTWFSVDAMRQSYADRESPTYALLDYFAKGDAHLRRNSTPFLRQLVTLGTSPIKVIWRHDEDELDVLREILDPDGNPTRKLEKVRETVVRNLGPTFTPVDLFAWYVYPVTCASVEDAVLSFEDVLMPLPIVKGRGDLDISPEDEDLGTIYDTDGVAQIVERMGDGYSRSETMEDKWNAERRRLADKGFTSPLNAKIPGSQKQVDIAQAIWRRLDPKTGVATRYLVDIGMDEIILRIQELPWMHGLPHILAGKFVEVVNEFYGRGLPEIFDRLQYTLNETGNQSLDSLTYAINPITVVDLYQVQDPTSLRYRPGAKWLASPTAVKAFEMDAEPAVVGLNALGTLMGAMDDLANIVPIGAPAGKARGRGTQSTAGMQLAVSEAQVDVHDVVESLEDQVYSPWLSRGHSLAIQYLEEPMILRIGGRGGVKVMEQKVDRLDLLGDFRFTWLGSSGAMNQQIKTGQMIQFMQVGGKIPQEQIAAEGKRIAWSKVISDFYTGLGLPNVDQVIVDLHPQEGTDPTLENDLFRVGRGKEVVVSEADDDDKHLAMHTRLAQQAVEADVPPGEMLHLQNHIRQHQAGKMAKRLMAQQQQMAQQQAAMQGGQPGQPGGGTNGTALNPGRLANTNSVSDLFRSAPRGQG